MYEWKTFPTLFYSSAANDRAPLSDLLVSFLEKTFLLKLIDNCGVIELLRLPGAPTAITKRKFLDYKPEAPERVSPET